MRIAPAKVLILIALFLVVLVETRTVLAFFDVDVAWSTLATAGIVAIVAFLVWATRPANGESPDQ